MAKNAYAKRLDATPQPPRAAEQLSMVYGKRTRKHIQGGILTMDVREKLVELLNIIIQPGQKTLGDIADYLIANGVTVQEWISIKDRLPEKDGSYLVVSNYFGNHQSINVRSFAKAGETVSEYDLAGEKNVWYRYDIECGYLSINSITHWMPLPQLPKGE